MGADFTFAMANVTKPKEYWQNYLSEMDDSHMESFVQESDPHFYWADIFDDVAPYSPEFLQKVAERVSEAIEVCYDTERRDMGYWHDDDAVYVVTGGMTWGDEPTDAFREVLMFDILQCWDQNTRYEEDN